VHNKSVNSAGKFVWIPRYLELVPKLPDVPVILLSDESERSESESESDESEE
jgi:hypothetical protein